MKSKQSGGPAQLAHRCFFACCGRAVALMACLTFVPSAALRAEATRNLEDYAQVYVDQYFEPGEQLNLSELARRKSKALAHYALGRSLESQGRAQDAVEAYTEVLRNQPDQFPLARKTAYLLARAGRLEEALKLLEDSLERNPGEYFVHLSLSEFLATYQGNDPAGLRRSFEVAEAAVERFPDEPAVYEHLVKLQLSADRRDEARRLVTQAADRESRDPEFWLRLGRLAARIWPASEGGEPSDAGFVNAIYAKALDHAGGDVSVAERVGDYYHATGQFDLAVAVYAPLIGAHPDRLELRMKLAQVFAAKGDQDKLVETLKEIVAIDPQNAEVHKQIAGIFLRAEKYKEAIPHFRAALSITKGGPDEYGALGRMMIEAREFEAAVEFLGEASRLFPENPDFAFLLAYSLYYSERWEESSKQFEKTLELAKDQQPQLLNERFYFHYAAATERAKSFDKAEELFRKTIEMIAKNDPAEEDKEFTATVYNYLGYMWLEIDKNLDEAGELIKTAAELSPESGAIADSLGWFHFKKGRYEEARDELLRAETLIETPDPVIYDHIGQTFFQLGEHAKAVSYLEKAVEMEPQNEEYSKRLEQYRKDSAKPAAPAPDLKPAEAPSAPAPAP